MRVLLTGAAGFIGARVGAALRAAGHDVVGVDVLLPAAHGPDPVLPAGCRQADVRDAEVAARASRLATDPIALPFPERISSS